MRMPAFLLVVLLLAGPAAAGELPRAAPADVGLIEAQLAKVDKTVQSFIESKATPGAVVAIARKGKVAYLKSFGTFKQDSIFRIYSMTKPVTVAAALMLVDDGKLKLDDPVSKYLPALAGVTVHGSEAKPAPITVRHLMQHTAGMTYGFFGNTAVDQRYRKAKLLRREHTLEDMVKELAAIPLLFEPGKRWNYSVSIDVLGRVIEVVSEKRFDVFLQERLFTPLGMTDTAFSVSDDKLSRFLPNHNAKGQVIDAPETSPYRKQPAFLSGGGGLVSTMADFMTFALMLAQGGEWNGKRYLKRDTVRLMTTNQLPEELIPIRMGPLPLLGSGFGLGVSVRVAKLGAGTRVGAWGWGGAASTTFIVSPEDELVLVTMIQRMPFWNGLDGAVKGLVYEAIKPAAAPVGAK